MLLGSLMYIPLVKPIFSPWRADIQFLNNQLDMQFYDQAEA